MTARIIHGLEGYTRRRDRCSAVTVGTFDGLHRGHQEILTRLDHAANTLDYDPILVTFHPHPRAVVTPKQSPKLLTTIDEKQRLLSELFGGEVIVLEFNNELRELSAQQFVESILIDRLGMNKLVVGYDHAFGRNREGTIVQLTELGRRRGFGINVVGPVNIGNQRVSSSAIRRSMREGDFSAALEMLGHPYPILGKVEKGIGLGRRLGYPTANVAYDPDKQLPPEGVYACRVKVDASEYEGMMFVGQNYFNPEERISVEANIFDFDQDIYGRETMLWPYRFLRANRRFDSTEELTGQIDRDKEEVLRIMQQEKR
jgi:riboflavin kinase/FMN adenylyltransferase